MFLFFVFGGGGSQDTPAELRQAVLGFPLIALAMNMGSKQRDGPGAVLVAFSKGEVHGRAGTFAGADLVGPALMALWSTMGHWVARFAKYKEYPQLVALGQDAKLGRLDGAL